MAPRSLRLLLLAAGLAAAGQAGAQNAPPPPEPLSTVLEARIEGCLEAAEAGAGPLAALEDRMAACIPTASRADGLPEGSRANRQDCWNAEWAAWWRVRARAYADLAALLPDPATPGDTPAHEAARALAEADAAWSRTKGGDCAFLALRWLGTLRTEVSFTCPVETEARRAITYRLWRHQAETHDGFAGGG